MDWKLRDNDLCQLCKQCSETLKHILFDCVEVKKVYDYLSYIADWCDIEINLSWENVILNRIHENPRNIMNMLCLHLKQFIYKIKCSDKLLNKRAWANDMLIMYQNEMYDAKRLYKTAKCARTMEPH